jgi:excisionase family DNA binding protein
MATASVSSELLTRQQAAEFLGVRPQTLSVWKLTGRYALPAIKVGSKLRYRRSDLERWLDSRTIGTTPAK